jgi:hypothetical protein
MTDLFSSYAEQATPAPVRRKQEDKPLSALDKKMAEKQRLSRAYRIWKREQRREVFIAEPRMRDFMRYVGRVRDGDELIEAIAESWLPASAQSVRLLALELVSRRCDRLNRSAGFEALDDPLPPTTSVYFRARHLLHEGGRA